MIVMFYDILTVGPSTICGLLLTRFDAWRSGRGIGAAVVGGAGVAIGKSVPNCFNEKIKKITIKF